MKRASIFASLLLASSAVFAERNVTYDYGTVIDSTPIVKTIRVTTPREECWDERVSHVERGDDGVGTVVGAVVGGAIGNAVGHNKTNKKVGAVVGAVLGGTIGKSVSRDSRRYVTTEEVCRVVNDYREEERIVGYHVKYRYNDVTYTTRTDHEPGETIKLRLAVSPVI